MISKAVKAIAAHGGTCGVITNDQAAQLVDTKTMRSAGAQNVGEVSGGCFCCRLEDLVNLLTDGGQNPNESGVTSTEVPSVVIAEPVGSCTDVVSTVLLPLEKVYKVEFVICPFSVVIDARRALSSLGGRRTPGDFSKDVGYIYRKQLEEAEIVVVN